jgi:hypothetical protein
MGIVTNSTGWVEASVPAPASRGVDRRTVIADVTLSGDYAAGGDPVVLPENIGDLRALTVSPPVASNYLLAWDGDVTTPKIAAYVMSDALDATVIGTEAEAATDLSSITVTLLAVFER